MESKTLEDEFNELAIKFIFVYDDEVELSSLLSELNGLNYKFQQIRNSNSVLQLIETLPKISTSCNPNIIVKACCLIKQLITKQKITLQEPASNKVVNWILQCISSTRNVFLCEALDVLTLLFKRNQHAVQQHADKMLNSADGILTKLIEDNPTENLQKSLALDCTPQEILNTTLSCMESILMHLVEQEACLEISDEDLEQLGQLLIKLLFKLNLEKFSENDYTVIVTLAINCLKFICQNNSDFTTEHVGELLGITKSFMMYSLPDFEHQQPAKIASSQQQIMEPLNIRPNRKAVGIKARKFKVPKKKIEGKGRHYQENIRTYGGAGVTEEPLNVMQLPTFPIYRTSDSDFSDTEHNREFVSRHKQSKLRQSALTLLSIVSIVEKRILFGYWHSLFATEESQSTVNLINSVLKDPSPRCRILALQNIIMLLKNSKPFLIQAENKEKAPTTFTPFSVTLGNMITFTYEKLTQALTKEGDLTVLTQILKCISIFIPVTPFNRLRSGIVTGFAKYVKLLVRHKDPTVKVAALIVMGNLVSIQDFTTEIYELVEIPRSSIEFSLRKIDESIRSAQPDVNDDEITDLEFDEEEDFEPDVPEKTNDASGSAEKMSWLLKTVLENLGVSNGNRKMASPATSVRIECLQVLTALTSHYLLLKDHLPSISIALLLTLKESSPADEKIYASRMLETLGSSMNNYLSQDKIIHQDLDASITFWLSVIPRAIELIQNVDQPTTLRASLADGLANIGVHVFEKLEHQKQIILISVLTGCGYDEDGSVRSSAIRALAVFVLFPSLREDLCYIENTTESILRIIKDPSALIRAKVSWALGNVVDALLIFKGSTTVNEELLKQIFSTSLESTNDNDRVKVNAVRTLGNLMTILSQKHLKETAWIELFEQAIKNLHRLLMKGGNFKVQWNICYSFSSLMKNPVLFEDGIKNRWQEIVFPALCNIIKISPNFKVRTNACIAFMVPKNRIDFGGHFINIWNCLLMALEQSNNLTDFNEYKHRDTLQDQICMVICHLINLMRLDDVVAMKNELFPLMDITKQNWNRVFNRWLPECQDKILAACASLTVTAKNCKSAEQKNSIEILLSCFKPIEQF